MNKRIFDLLFASVALVVLSPVFLVIASIVKLRLGSPILFKQVRPGYHGKPFTVLKFRTMTDVKDKDGTSLPDEQRLTPFGSWLRSSSLDELPELWNVLKGEMSMVGPRPLLMEYLPLYSPEQSRRHNVRPGITGWAQINGRNALTWEEKFALDVWYVDNHSIAVDLKILCKTIAAVVQRKGISHSGEVTMPRFVGNQKGKL